MIRLALLSLSWAVYTAAQGPAVGNQYPPVGTVVLSQLAPDGSAVHPAPGSSDSGDSSLARLVNLSTIARVSQDNPLALGFTVRGPEPLEVLLRAVGPSLRAFQVTDVLIAPRLQLLSTEHKIIVENNNWAETSASRASISRAVASTGAFPFSASATSDAAVVVSLAPGNYTLLVLDDSGQGGNVIAEVYAVNRSDSARLVNVSTRIVVAREGTLASGFVVSGSVPRKFLIRGIGPGLAKFGISNFIVSPAIKLFTSSGTVVASNDNWTYGPWQEITYSNSGVSVAIVNRAGSNFAAYQLRAAANAVGAFALDFNDSDAALFVTLQPGPYSVQMSGGAAGTALLEIYEIP